MLFQAKTIMNQTAEAASIASAVIRDAMMR